MKLQLYTLSGSPFGWKVQLALGHKGIPHDVHALSPDRGDLDTPWFRILNPRGKLPVLVHDALTLSESDAILGYVDEAFANVGPPLFARDAAARATERMIGIGLSSYLYPPVRTLVMAWTRAGAVADPEAITAAKAQIGYELAMLVPRLTGPFFGGNAPGAVDFTLLPLVALLKRLAGRRPDDALEQLVPDVVTAWRTRFEALAIYAKSYPPHWSA